MPAGIGRRGRASLCPRPRRDRPRPTGASTASIARGYSFAAVWAACPTSIGTDASSGSLSIFANFHARGQASYCFSCEWENARSSLLSLRTVLHGGRGRGFWSMTAGVVPMPARASPRGAPATIWATPSPAACGVPGAEAFRGRPGPRFGGGAGAGSGAEGTCSGGRGGSRACRSRGGPSSAGGVSCGSSSAMGCSASSASDSGSVAGSGAGAGSAFFASRTTSFGYEVLGQSSAAARVAGAASGPRQRQRVPHREDALDDVLRDLSASRGCGSGRPSASAASPRGASLISSRRRMSAPSDRRRSRGGRSRTWSSRLERHDGAVSSVRCRHGHARQKERER